MKFPLLEHKSIIKRSEEFLLSALVTDLCGVYTAAENFVSAGFHLLGFLVLDFSVTNHDVGTGDFPQDSAAAAAGLVFVGGSGRENAARCGEFLERCVGHREFLLCWFYLLSILRLFRWVQQSK